MEKIWLLVIGGILGAVPTLIMGWINIRAAEERQRKQIDADHEKNFKALAVQMALTDYQMACDAHAKRLGIPRPSFHYILPAYQIIKKIMDSDVSPDDFDEVFEEAKIAHESARVTVFKDQY